MRSSTLLALASSLSLTGANIPVNYKITLSCNTSSPDYTGCLRGMECVGDEICVKPEVHSMPEPHYLTTSSEMEVRSLGQLTSRAYSSDGKCGPSNGGLLCDPNSKVYTGTCCSQYGWCGNTAGHCGTGCTSGCTTNTGTTGGGGNTGTTPAYSTDGKCGPSNGGLACDPNSKVYTGTCCSQYGWCGNTAGHCGTGCTSGCSGNTGTTGTGTGGGGNTGTTPAYSTDGKCGPANGGLACDPNSKVYSGTCCSQYGWCGNTAGHCGTGCLSGCSGQPSGNPTTPVAVSSSAEPVLGVPSTAPVTGPQTTDGTCGAGNGNTYCGNWPQGGCCSLYGFCGSSTAHCGNGCQSGPCTNAPAVPGPAQAPVSQNPGAYNIVGQSGVPAMHAGLLPNGRVVFLDKVEDYSQIKLPSGYYAYSSEYDPATNTAVGLSYKSNAFCSGGAFLADGRFVSLGGNAPLTFIDPTVGDGFTAIRYLDRANGANTGQSWSEPGNRLSSARWYASAQTMPDGTIFVASGSLNGLDPTVIANNNPTYEILSPVGISSGQSITLDILVKNQPYYMYPFIHLLSTGNLFIFVSKSAEIFNVGSNAVVATLPDLPGDYRTYPNTGASVLLPLSSATNWAPDIVICGGGAYQDITSPTDPSCGRIQPLSNGANWQMEAMPEGRGMVEGVLLLDGTVVFLNGCNQGAQGFGLATAPTLEALIYNPTAAVGNRFQRGASSTIARLYHSVALLLLDGTLMVAGSNPVQQPVLTPVAGQTPSEDYVTEFRVEIYTPPYLQGNPARPSNIVLSSLALRADGSQFNVKFTAPGGNNACKVILYHGGFVTHSLHMGHRMLFLDTTGYQSGATTQSLTVSMPPNKNVAPPGPYVVYVTCNNVPGLGQFVMVS